MLYADDTQVCKSFDLDDCLSSILCVEKCVSDVKTWMMSNTLQVNEDKTDVLLVTAKRIFDLQYLPEVMNINGTCIKFSPLVRNLGVTLDSTLSLHHRVMNVCKFAYLELRLNSIRNILCVDAVKTLVCLIVLSCLDYCNSLLVGLPQDHIKRL